MKENLKQNKSNNPKFIEITFKTQIKTRILEFTIKNAPKLPYS